MTRRPRAPARESSRRGDSDSNGQAYDEARSAPDELAVVSSDHPQCRARAQAEELPVFPTPDRREASLRRSPRCSSGNGRTWWGLQEIDANSCLSGNFDHVERLAGLGDYRALFPGRARVHRKDAAHRLRHGDPLQTPAQEPEIRDIRPPIFEPHQGFRRRPRSRRRALRIWRWTSFRSIWRSCGARRAKGRSPRWWSISAEEKRRWSSWAI